MQNHCVIACLALHVSLWHLMRFWMSRHFCETSVRRRQEGQRAIIFVVNGFRGINRSFSSDVGSGAPAATSSFSIDDDVEGGDVMMLSR